MTEQPSRRDRLVAIAVGVLLMVGGSFFISVALGPIPILVTIAVPVVLIAVVACAAWLIA